MPLSPRSYGTTHRFLELEGEGVGFVASAEGGDAVAEVVRVPTGGTAVRKHLGGVSFTDLQMRLDLVAAAAVSGWISASWEGKVERRSGTLFRADYDLRVREAREFADAALAGVSFPALDLASKEVGLFGIRLRPRSTRDRKESGQLLPGPSSKTKRWISSAFRLEIEGLDGLGVVRIDPFEVRQSLVEENAGNLRRTRSHAAPIDFPDLRVTLSARGFESWAEWHRRSVIQGESGDQGEKNGSLVLLSQDLRTEMGRVELFGLGIFGLASAATDARVDGQRFVADLFCERMQLKLDARASAVKVLAPLPAG